MSTIEEILASPGQKEVVVEIDSIKRSDYSAKTWYYTTHFRETGASETPANTPFPQYLHLEHSSLGPLSQALSEDLFSGLAAINAGTLTLVQSDLGADQLSQLHDYIFAGRQVRIRIGLDSSATYDSSTFPTFATLTVKVDPSVDLTSNGIEASFPLASATDRLLSKNLQTKRYHGIPHCFTILTQSGKAATTSNGTDLLSYTLVGMFRGTSASATNSILLEKNLGGSRNYNVHIGSSGGGYAGRIRFRATISGVDTTFVTSPASVLDGVWHTWAAALLDKTTAYLMIDNEVVGTFTPSNSVDFQSAVIGVGFVNFTPVGSIGETRIYPLYLSPAQVRPIIASRSDGSHGELHLWRFDDNTGTTANDYGSGNLDLTMSGTQNVDWKWDSTDLGEPELSGRPYPINVGEVFNARAQLIDAARERYRANVDAVDWHTSTSNTTLTVKSRGTVLTGGGVDYTAPSNGGDGVFSTTAQEDEPVTFDLANNGSSIDDFFLPEVSYRLMDNRTGLGGSFDDAQLLRLTAMCPWKAGYRTETDTTAGAALAELLSNSGLSYFETDSGDLFIDLLWPPLGYGPYGEPCLDFRGESDAALDYGDVADISGSCTVACWFNTRVVSESITGLIEVVNLIAKPSSGAVEYALYIPLYGDKGRFVFRIGSNDSSSPAGVIVPDQWYFAAAVFDDTANTVKLYLAADGESVREVVNVANTAAPVTQTNHLMIGGENGKPWVAVQHAQVWNATKTLVQIQALMDTPPAGTESGLLFYAPLNEGAGNPADLVNSTTATLIAPARWSPYLTVDLGVTPSVVLSDFHRLDPAGEIIVQYGRNWSPMSASDIDTGVSQNTALDLKREWKEVGAQDPEILAAYEHSKKIVLPSALTTQTGAEKLYGVLANRFSEDRWIGKLTFPPGLEISAKACGLRLMDEIGVIAPIPSQLAGGRSYRVIAVAPNLLDLSTMVVFWG